MLMKSDYRDRAVGLVGAFAVLIIGIIATGALANAPAVVSTKDAVHAVNITTAHKDEGCSLASRLDEPVPVC